MSTYKKIGIGLFLAFGGLVTLFLAPTHKAFAFVATSPDQITGATFSFVDADTINATVGGGTVIFKMNTGNSVDGTLEYDAQGYDCPAKITFPGMTRNKLLLQGLPITGQATVDIDYNPNSTGCNNIPGNTIQRTVQNANLANADFVQTDQNTITGVFTSNGGNLKDIFSDSFTLGADGLYHRTSEGGNCADIIKVSGNQMTVFELDRNNGVVVDGNSLGIGDIRPCRVEAINIVNAPKNPQDAITLSKQTIPIASPNTTTGGGPAANTNCTPAQNGQISGGVTCVCTVSGTTTPVQTCTWTQSGTVSAADTDSDCAAKAKFALSWVMCPMLSAADTIMRSLVSTLTGLLSFTVKPATPLNNDPMWKAWDQIKNLATILLVIVLLIMVSSEAISIGPFDAYTVRKLLPKLVAAVIFIQLSWYLFVYVIQLFDDLGRGIADLLFAPFGGASATDLFALLAHANVSGATAAGFSWAALIGATALAVFNLPLLLGLAWMVVLSLFIGVAVLIFRQALIIMCLVLAPLALLAWILPGTERYWTLWRKTFIQLLMMFPLIIAIIAAGRIFAYIAAPAVSQSTNNGGELIAFLMVLIGFFGPLFILPKAFSWGGQLMGAAGNLAGKGIKGAGKPVTGLLDDAKARSRWTQARAARKSELDRRARAGFAEGLAGSGAGQRLNRARLIGIRPGKPGMFGGKGVTSTEADIGRRITQHAEAEVDKNKREEIAAATTQLMQRDLIQYHPSDHDAIRRAIISGEKVMVHTANEDPATTAAGHEFDGAAYEASHPHGLRAALDRGVVHGHWREIEQYGRRVMASGNEEHIAEYQDFLQSNAPAVGDQMTHMLKGMNIAATSKPEGIVKMRQEEIESLLGTLSTKAAAGDTEAAGQLSVFLRNYATTASDGRLRTQLDQGGARAVKAFVEAGTAGGDSMIRRINFDPAVAGRHNYGLDLIDGRVKATMAADADTNTAMATLSRRISDDGVVKR